jgi:hypothetical protein
MTIATSPGLKELLACEEHRIRTNPKELAEATQLLFLM